MNIKLKKVQRGKDKQATMYWGMMYYLECPYCKKTIIHAEPEEVKVLRKWKKQKDWNIEINGINGIKKSQR